MKRRPTTRTTAWATAAVLAAGTGLVATLGGGTAASFTDAEHATPARAGAASVVLGRDSGGPELGFDGLTPGRPAVVPLTIDYRGSVDAQLSLSLAPDGESAFCEHVEGRWRSRPGVPVTLATEQGGSVNYCALYDGRRLPLGGATPGQVSTVPITLTLSADAAAAAGGLAELAAATVHADGGFTDSATGVLTATTASPEALLDVRPGLRPTVSVALRVGAAQPGAVGVVNLDVTDPAASAKASAAGQTVPLPQECEQAGIEASAITEVIALDPVEPKWDAQAARGLGAGPFLVLGTAGPDEITTSDGGDCVVAGGGDDEVTGGEVDDVVLGGPGADKLTGGTGDDHLLGGTGLDELTGGVGGDVLAGGGGDATCDAAPTDVATGCLPPPTVAPAAPPTVPPVSAKAETPPPPAPTPAPAVSTPPPSSPPPSSPPPSSPPPVETETREAGPSTADREPVARAEPGGQDPSAPPGASTTPPPPNGDAVSEG